MSATSVSTFQWQMNSYGEALTCVIVFALFVFFLFVEWCRNIGIVALGREVLNYGFISKLMHTMTSFSYYDLWTLGYKILINYWTCIDDSTADCMQFVNDGIKAFNIK